MRYLGNKTRLLNEIEFFINERNIKGNDFFDIFSGTGSVAEHFKNKYETSSNDYMTFSYNIQSSKLLNSEPPLFTKLNKELKMDVFDYLNSVDTKELKPLFISKNYSEGNSDRLYFSKENGLMIDSARVKIDEWSSLDLINKEERSYLMHSLLEAVTKVSNTTGTYGAFLKKLDNRAVKRIYFDRPKLLEGKGKKTYNKDAESLIREIEGDILYIDPPYTNFNYSRGYHILETIARFDLPEIRGITGVRTNGNNSNFSSKVKALSSFENLIRHANFNDIIISYSNHGIIPKNDLLKMLDKYSIGKPFIKEIDYREYKTVNSPNKEPLKEFLIHIKKDKEIIKSPLNYEGNKFKLIKDIQYILPKQFNKFFDVFGGSGTVSLNILGAKEIHYNDINSNTFMIVKHLFNRDLKLIEKINEEISENKLEKGNKKAFYEYREKVNAKKNAINLITLSFFSFQNMIRQNSDGKINIPSGLSTFNQNSKKNILLMNERLNNINVKCHNKSFDVFLDGFLTKGINSEDVFYFDPPYAITTASYNDGKRGFEGWDKEDEIKLLKYIKEIDDLGGKFILSNVVNHKGQTNHPLSEFVETHNFKVIKLKDKGRNEVIITNIYDKDIY